MALFSNKEKRLRDAFNQVHLEFEDHLDSINTNTNEIFENRTILLELSARIEELACELADVKRMLADDSTTLDAPYKPIELTLREQEVFLSLYTSSEITYEELAQQLTLPVSLVQDIVYDLIMKEVPVIKRRQASRVYLSLDLEFREYQSRHNIVGIDEGISRQLSKDLQLTLVD